MQVWCVCVCAFAKYTSICVHEYSSEKYFSSLVFIEFECSEFVFKEKHKDFKLGTAHTNTHNRMLASLSICSSVIFYV